MSSMTLDEFLQKHGTILPEGLSSSLNPTLVFKNERLEAEFRTTMDRLAGEDVLELFKILDLAVKAESKRYKPSASMRETFISKVMSADWTFYETTAPPPQLALPCHSELYEYAEDPDNPEHPEIPPEVSPYELVLELNIRSGKTRFFARSDDDRKEFSISWQTFGSERMARLALAIRADILSEWEEYNANRAIQHARFYLHRKWGSFDAEAPMAWTYDFAPLDLVFEHLPYFLINHEEKAPRFWCEDAKKIETLSISDTKWSDDLPIESGSKEASYGR